MVNLTSRDSATLPEVQFMLQMHELRRETFNSAFVMDASHVQAHLVHKQTPSSSFGSYNSFASQFSSQGKLVRRSWPRW